MWEKSLVTNSTVGLVLLNGCKCIWVKMQAPKTCQKDLTVMLCQIYMTNLMSYDTATIEPGPSNIQKQQLHLK